MKKAIAAWLLLIGLYTNAQRTDSTETNTNLSTLNDTAKYPTIPLQSYQTLRNVSAQRTKLRSFILPAAMISYGFISHGNEQLKSLDSKTGLEIKEDHPTRVTKIDNYLQFSPAVAVYALNAFGIKGKNNLRDRSMLYGISSALMVTTVFSIKKLSDIERPDGSDNKSFPSGHTANAFASAEFMRQEYKDVSPWYGVAGYAAAAATGVLRVYNNKHWISDVITGAGIGIMSTKVAYWIYPAIKKRIFKDKAVSTMVMPFYQNGGGGLSLVHHFH